MSKKDFQKRCKLKLNQLEPNATNPNKMPARAFDLLVANISETGSLIDPIWVRPIGKDRYRIIGGHHRWEAAKYLGWDEADCVVNEDPNFDDEAETFQLVRMNVIRGKLDPQAFFDLYSKMSTKYATDVLQEMFGFAEQEEFKRLITQTAKMLPADMQKTFKEAAKEIKTIDGLSKLLNEMFTKYGSTLPVGFMVFDYGGQKSVWLQSSKKTLDSFSAIGDLCRERNRTVDDIVGSIVQSIAKGGLKDAVEAAVASTKEVEMPAGYTGIPTQEDLNTYAAM